MIQERTVPNFDTNSIKITKEEGRILVEDQTRLNITCTSLGYPKPSFFWYSSPEIHHSNSVMQEDLHSRQMNLEEWVNRSLYFQKVSSLIIMNTFLDIQNVAALN